MIPGVSWSAANRRWRASLSGFGHRGYIGEFLTEAEATAARRDAELLIDGRYHDQAQCEVVGDLARVPLWGRRGVLRGWATVDVADLALVSGSRWSLSPTGYAVARIAGRTPAMHLVLLSSEGHRDHINGDRLDNRRANLRACAPCENARNSAPTRGRKLPKGVSLTQEGTFRARLMLNRREIWLGRYDTAEEAARAYDAGAIKHFGQFARPNHRVEAFAPQEGDQ